MKERYKTTDRQLKECDQVGTSMEVQFGEYQEGSHNVHKHSEDVEQQGHEKMILIVDMKQSEGEERKEQAQNHSRDQILDVSKYLSEEFSFRNKC